MFKKMMLAGSMALAALAFAIPVSGASANWTHEGSPLASDAAVTFTGAANFNLEGSATGAHANVDIGVTLKAGTTTATVTSFKDTNCTGTGALNGLRCTGTPIGLPWDAHIVGDNITITKFELDTHYYSPLDPNHTSPVSTTVLKGNLWATVDDPEGISQVTIENDGSVTANGSPAVVHGLLNVSPAGTYGTT